MTVRRLGIAAIIVVLAVVVMRPASAPAGDVVNFDPKAFAAAQNAGESVVVAIHAPW